jgi:Peptidoglycan-synthase activator LpoB
LIIIIIEELNVKKTIVSFILLFIILSCGSNPSTLNATEFYSDKVSYILDSENEVDLPRITAIILDGNVEGLIDWDKAHNQLLNELIFSNIFRSVVKESERLVDYGVKFDLSELSNDTIQVHYEFINMHTGDSVFTGITKGNKKNGNFGFAFIKDTETSYDDSFTIQKRLVLALSKYKIEKEDISGTSMAVLRPSVDETNLPEDEEIRNLFYSFVENRFLMVVENALVNTTNANIVNRDSIELIVSELSLSLNDLFNQNKAAEIGEFLGADFVLMSKITYNEDGYFFIYLKIIDIETLRILHSTVFETNLWDNRVNQFDIGTYIDRLFHNEAE